MSGKEIKYRILETDKGFIPQIENKNLQGICSWDGLGEEKWSDALFIKENFFWVKTKRDMIKYCLKKTYKKALKVIEKHKKKELSETFDIIKTWEIE